MAVLPPDILLRPPAARALAAGPGRSYALAALAGLVALAAEQAGAFPHLAPTQWLPAMAGYGVASALVAAALARRFPHAALGWCNVVTQVRLALVALLATPLMAQTGAGGWIVAALALAVLALDGVDGWLARRQGLCSAFGARFDMEVDAALALVLALHALHSGTVGAGVLLLGLARYAFVAATFIWPWLSRPLPHSRARKAVCVAQLSALIAVQAPVVGDAASGALTLAVAAALLWSFGRDVLWLSQARARHGWA
jgi:phosphatidylglycerophosphate synthase